MDDAPSLHGVAGRQPHRSKLTLPLPEVPVSLNQFPPPSNEFFINLPPRGQAAPLVLEIGGWSYRLEQLDEPTRERLAERFAGFMAVRPTGPSLRIRILQAEEENFIPPEPRDRSVPHPLSQGWAGSRLGLRSYGFVGWVEPATSVGEVALARGEYEKPEWCLENYLRVCTAWKAVTEGGVLLHGAGIEREQKAFVFIGASGSGKSTLAATSLEGRVISDDLTLIRWHESRFQVAGTPFRGTYQAGEPVGGFFPVEGIYRIRQATENRLQPCPKSAALAGLLANSPFVVDQLSQDERVLAVLEALQEAHPVSYLDFNLQGNFWEVLQTGGGGGR